ncbi:hypothetical protein [Halomonas organivorans]|uniref:Uncharacterized protein n=1 Tax=Halomonas organivorans TaxID=257772 RepID=A0A7W5G717_9GAMM|nr:hypothetical protein [Halomonas organivorans]MBB3142775.1 hypothetical protein [Halomonas organivorans]
MNNYELDQKTQELADSHSRYELAKMLIREREGEQALAAHVEWLDGLRRNVIEAIRDDRFEDLDVSFYRDDMQPPHPATNLARRDADQRAQELESFAEHCRMLGHNAHINGYHQAGNAAGDMADEAIERADEIRRQAEQADTAGEDGCST